MQWLNKIADELVARYPKGEILVESGHSPSGTYHLGHMRELVTCDAIVLELRRRDRQAKHISYVDDLDALRKVPFNVDKSYEKYLGMSLCDIPSPDGRGSYSEHFLAGLKSACQTLKVDVEFIYSHLKYRDGFFVTAIEKVLDNLDLAKKTLVEISGRQLGEDWSPIQVNEDGYLKKRQFVSLDKPNKTLTYLDKDGNQQTISYALGEVKLDWRLDWPARWWLMKIGVEPFGRDHATKGGSYDTGAQIMKDIFKTEAPYPVPYDFINLAGETKKMSASKGTGLDAAEAAKVMPPEVWRYFILSPQPSKRLYFDPINGVVQLMDEFAELMNKSNKSQADEQLLEICRRGVEPTVSRVPFSHLVASYQAALKNPEQTIEVMKRTEHNYQVEQNIQILKDELKYIDQWLDKWAPEDVKFSLSNSAPANLSDTEKSFLNQLATKIESAPADADGEWFHNAIYELKDSTGVEPKEIFVTLYKTIIGKTSGPRAGWFLSILPRDWLIKRLHLEA